MTYDPTAVTLDELIGMADLLEHKQKIAAKSYDRALRALEAAHGCPSTHADAHPNAQELARVLSGDPKLTIKYPRRVYSGNPRLHYADEGGGVHPAFTDYAHPAKFDIRPRPPRPTGTWTLICTDHITCYHRCELDCLVGVQFNGQFLIDIVRGH